MVNCNSLQFSRKSFSCPPKAHIMCIVPVNIPVILMSFMSFQLVLENTPVIRVKNKFLKGSSVKYIEDKYLTFCQLIRVTMSKSHV